jgi:hypothetical protein
LPSSFPSFFLLPLLLPVCAGPPMGLAGCPASAFPCFFLAPVLPRRGLAVWEPSDRPLLEKFAAPRISHTPPVG